MSLEPASTVYTDDRVGARFSPTLTLALHNTTASGLFVSAGYTRAGIEQVDVNVGSTGIGLRLFFRAQQTIYNGTYLDQLTVNVCRDEACAQPIAGSPVRIPISYTLTGTDPITGLTGPPPDPDVAPLTIRSRIALRHDVRDAEYSRSLDRIVMVARYPRSALYVYDAMTGTEQSVALSKPPTAVTVSPDGLSAAVGHDGLISLIDLSTLGQPGAPAPAQLTVPDEIFDLVLDGHGRVHYLPDSDLWEWIRTFDLTTGSEFIDKSATVYGRSTLRMDPSGNFLFVNDAGSSGISKFDVSNPVRRYVSRGDGGCKVIWLDYSGQRLYSDCREVFDTEDQPNRWMLQVGSLEVLLGTPLEIFGIEWLDTSALLDEVSLLESNSVFCKMKLYFKPCYFRLTVFDRTNLTRRETYALPPVDLNGVPYVQYGMFVFYRTDGSGRLLLSRVNASDPEAEYYLSALD